MTRVLLSRAAAMVAALCLLAACEPAERPPTPAEVRAQIVRLLPAKTADRKGWAADIESAFSALEIKPTTQNLCATLAITEQESGFNSDPPVPGLGKIALAEIERRAAARHIPGFLVRGALRFASHDGHSYADQLAAVSTEQDLSRLFEEFIDSVPLGRQLFAGANPVHTGGPMQVSVVFAQQHARSRPYPYETSGSIRHEVFTRRGGMYFGIAHLLGYPAPYPGPLYRFADFNAGFYASRNAAFQKAVSLASGIAIPLDGDLVRYGKGGNGNPVGETEAAVRALGRQLELTDAQIHRALQQGESIRFQDSSLYQRVFDLAEQLQHRALPRAMLPRIDLRSPKITRKLTTEWFATRVDQRYQRCLARAGAPVGARSANSR
jgi:hypothetical protein